MPRHLNYRRVANREHRAMLKSEAHVRYWNAIRLVLKACGRDKYAFALKCGLDYYNDCVKNNRELGWVTTHGSTPHFVESAFTLKPYEVNIRVFSNCDPLKESMWRTLEKSGYPGVMMIYGMFMYTVKNPRDMISRRMADYVQTGESIPFIVVPPPPKPPPKPPKPPKPPPPPPLDIILKEKAVRQIPKTYDWVEFGRRLVKARTVAGLSQKNLLDRFGGSRNTIMHAELGRNLRPEYSLWIADHYARVTGVSLKWIIQGGSVVEMEPPR